MSSYATIHIESNYLYCPRCGTRLAARQSEGRLRPSCPSCGHVVYESLKVGAGVLVEREGSLLLVQRGAKTDAFPGTWNLPAGYCEADEPPPTTAAREAAEEIGLEVEVGRLVNVYFFDDDPRGNGLLLVYDAEIAGGDPQQDDWRSSSTEEVDAVRFFPPDRLPRPLCGGGHDQAIQDWQRRTLDRWQPGTPPRYCPHCTHPLEERPSFDRLRPVCPACGFVHFRAPKVGVSVLVEHSGQVVLVQRGVDPGRGKWCLPSGFVEWDEDPLAAAARECLEEAGLVATHLELLNVTRYAEDFRGPGVNIAYRARASRGTLHPGDDAVLARWFAREDLPPGEMIAFTSHRVLLEQWRRQ